MSFKYMLSNKVANDKYQHFPPTCTYCWRNLQMEYSYSHPGVLPADGSITLLF